MSRKPFFSIVMPCWNAEAHLDATIRSVRKQTFGSWELIAVDDGSTDTTRERLARWRERDLRIKIFALDRSGPSAARNFGALWKARGEVIAFLDADDLWTPHRLEKLHRVMSGDGAWDAVYNRVAFFRNSRERIDTRSSVKTGPLTIRDLIAENPVCTMSNIAIRSDKFWRTGGFDPTLVHNEDVEWMIRMVAAGVRIKGLGDTLTYYRASPMGLSQNLRAMQRGWAAAAKTAKALDPTLTKGALRRAEAIHLRYLARRALRTGAPDGTALGFALDALRASPMGFFNVPRRGLMTLFGAVLAPILPRRLHPQLFG
ncbi:MAG: glycosyltransferase family 2 protein [Rhodospirillaceae bacterium]